MLSATSKQFSRIFTRRFRTGTFPGFSRLSNLTSQQSGKNVGSQFPPSPLPLTLRRPPPRQQPQAHHRAYHQQTPAVPFPRPLQPEPRDNDFPRPIVARPSHTPSVETSPARQPPGTGEVAERDPGNSSPPAPYLQHPGLQGHSSGELATPAHLGSHDDPCCTRGRLRRQARAEQARPRRPP